MKLFCWSLVWSWGDKRTSACTESNDAGDFLHKVKWIVLAIASHYSVSPILELMAALKEAVPSTNTLATLLWWKSRQRHQRLKWMYETRGDCRNSLRNWEGGRNSMASTAE